MIFASICLRSLKTFFLYNSFNVESIFEIYFKNSPCSPRAQVLRAEETTKEEKVGGERGASWTEGIFSIFQMLTFIKQHPWLTNTKLPLIFLPDWE